MRIEDREEEEERKGKWQEGDFMCLRLSPGPLVHRSPVPRLLPLFFCFFPFFSFELSNICWHIKFINRINRITLIISYIIVNISPSILNEPIPHIFSVFLHSIALLCTEYGVLHVLTCTE